MNIITHAMSIIMDAGDARMDCVRALEALKQWNFTDAENFLKTAKEKIVSAHVKQTQVIQLESSGEIPDYSILFTHAQDTLMTVDSEIELVEHLMELYKNIDTRFQALEK